MKEVDGEHSGENMAKYAMNVIIEYGIERNLGYFVTDNAPDNDAMMAPLSLALRRDHKLQYDPLHYRIRCQGHVINLAVKSFLFVTNKENIEEDRETNVFATTIKDIEAWRKKGPLGKLHNFVVFLAQSTQRLHHFLDLSGNHRIPRDNSTHWNSWYMMLMTAWILRDAIEEFFDLYATPDLKADRLTDQEWATIRTIKDFLEKLSMSTKACESKQSTLDLTLPSTDYILSLFEKLKAEHKDNPIFSPMFNSGWSKMDKYYRLSDDTPAYIAAIVLHPSRKWRYIERHWKSEWIAPAKASMRDFWEKKYKPSDETTTSSDPCLAKSPNEFFEWLKEDDDTLIGDEYSRYCALPQVPGIKQGYRWWLEPTQQTSFPNLSKMALNILSIPAMSADPERLFSGAKITISDRRNRLGIHTIEALECLKSWLGIEAAVEDDIEDEYGDLVEEDEGVDLGGG